MNATANQATDAPTASPVDLSKHTFLVLGGGPDGEREVSIRSATGIANGLKAAGLRAHLQIIDTPTLAELKALPGDAIIPYLHGPWGEGGPLQDLLEQDGRPYLGSGPRPARTAMDKVATKMAAMDLGIPTMPCWVLSLRDPVCPARLPVIIKPIHEGSTLGLHVCTSHQQFAEAVAAIAAERASGIDRAYMIEPKIGSDRPARELTVGLLDGVPLPIIEITPKDGLYDFQSKYNRNDTVYRCDPEIPEKIAKQISKATARLAKAIGCRHIARADFMLDPDGHAWFLEINTTPGFTDHSLVPKAAAHAGIPMPELCRRLAEMTIRDARRHPTA
ncbi:MAG: hypothetical protein LW650_09030 [Planctomycetaceae bacterium]|nr:D-alanine--D-alanine ligase [Phycisphaerales bacterium]MCE2653621.1 hypothetical protein [Planctomycetaceae bacterium]